MVGRSIIGVLLAGGIVAAIRYMRGSKQRRRFFTFGFKRSPLSGRSLSRIGRMLFRQVARAR